MVESDSETLATRPEDEGMLARPVPSELTEADNDRGCRIALLTPYDGGNLGDAAIQDAMIENIRRRLPGVWLSGISLSCENFLNRHGGDAFPLSETDRPFYKMVRKGPGNSPREKPGFLSTIVDDVLNISLVKKIRKKIPSLGTALKAVPASVKEFRHCVDGYRFLRTQDLLIVSGGGQLDEEWGGPWGHPFALFKWSVLAWLAKVPYVVASVGACKVRSTAARLLVSGAMRLARYRSYRDKNSRDIVAGLLRRASSDPIVPDLAFGLSLSEIPRSAGIRSLAAGREVIAISPIAFAKPHNWPQSDPELYSRYLLQLVGVIATLLDRGHFLVMVSSSRGDDESVIPEILGRLDDESKKKVERQICIPQIATWRDYVSVVREADFLIASRLHSTILGFIAHRPTVAISFDPKVDWAMEDLGQTEYLLHIRDFVTQDVIKAVERLQLRRADAIEELAAYQRQSTSALASQYDSLTEMAVSSRRSRMSIQK
jgi:polysaccharide pyruvyl transferase WcaK-like protein